MHAQEKGYLYIRIETTILDKSEVETPKVVKDQALITNSNLWTSQLDFLEQVERL